MGKLEGRKIIEREDSFSRALSIVNLIVNLGTGYETLGISKAGTIQSQLDVEPTVTLHNLLFLVRKLISNKLVEAFDWLSSAEKSVFCGVLCRVKAKKANKNMKQRNLSSFITSLHLLTMLCLTSSSDTKARVESLNTNRFP